MVPVWIIGVSLMILACLFNGIHIICLSSVITSRNLPLVGFARSVVQLSVVQPFLVARQCPYWGNPGERKSFWLCSIFGGAHQTMTFVALSLASASDSCAIVMSYPVIVSLISHFFNSSIKFQKRYLFTGLLTLCGTFLVTKPDFLFQPDALDGGVRNRYYGYAFAGLSSFLVAGLSITSERLKTTPYLASTSASSYVPVAVFGVYACVTGVFGDYLSCGTRAIFVILSGVFDKVGLAFYYSSFQYSADARVLSIVGATEIPMVFLMDAFILGTKVTVVSVCGMILIFVSLIAIGVFKSGLLDASKTSTEQTKLLVFKKTDTDLNYTGILRNDLIRTLESRD